MLACSLMMIKYLIESKRNVANGPHPNERKRQIKFAINALSINFIFFVTSIPNGIYELYYFYYSSSIDIVLNFYLGQFLLLCFYAYFGSTFYVNVLVNSIFREEFLALIYHTHSTV